MPSRPALPMVIRLVTKTAGNESRANDMANNTQSTKNGSHALKAMAERVMTLRTIALRLSQLSPHLSLIDRENLPVHRKRVGERVMSLYVGERSTRRIL